MLEQIAGQVYDVNGQRITVVSAVNTNTYLDSYSNGNMAEFVVTDGTSERRILMDLAHLSNDKTIEDYLAQMIEFMWDKKGQE